MGIKVRVCKKNSIEIYSARWTILILNKPSLKIKWLQTNIGPLAPAAHRKKYLCNEAIKATACLQAFGVISDEYSSKIINKIQSVERDSN